MLLSCVDVIPTADNEGVKLTAVCTTKPEITIDGYKGIQVKSNVPEITQEDIDKQGMNMELYFKYTGTNEAEFREKISHKSFQIYFKNF